MSGPYRLKKFHVKNYKILEDSEFKFKDINILIGPNGAGKTALWEVMSLIRNLANGWDDDFLNRQVRERARTGFPEIVTHFDANRRITLELQIGEPQSLWDYEVAFGYDPARRSVYTSFERLRQNGNTIIEAGAGQKKLLLRRKANKRGEEELTIDLGAYPLLLSTRIRPSWSIWGREDVEELGYAIANWSFYRFDMRHLGEDFKTLNLDYGSDRLEPQGYNLPKVLFEWKQSRDLHWKFQRVRELFKTALGLSGFEELDFDVELDTKVHLLILKLYKGDRFFDPAYGPDGWKAMLLLFTALVQDDTGLVFIEEPETHIHPHFMELLAEEIKVATERGVQVFCTTHSISFVNYFEPSRLIILDQGKPRRTKIGPKLREVALTLGDAWLLGLLGD